MAPLLLLIVVGALVGAALWAFRWAPRLESGRRDAAHAGAQILASVITAVGVLTAGLLYVVEQQWSPRFDVELKANTYSVPTVEPPVAIVHVVVSITNEGRTSHEIRGIEMGAVGLTPTATSTMDEYGDLRGKVIQTYSSIQTKSIRPGETDFAYAELAIPCSFSVARIIVKVPRPPHTVDTPLGKRRVYQRKLLVPLSQACSETREPIREPANEA